MRGAILITIEGRRLYRPNKQAAGMTRTASRRSGLNQVNHTDYGRGEGKLLPLMVWGTLDKLARGYWFVTKRNPCPCCGSKSAGRVALNDMGRARLARLRASRVAGDGTRIVKAYQGKPPRKGY